MSAGMPGETVARCVILARCPAPFHVTPAFISFGTLVGNELNSVSRELRLDSVDGQPALDPDRLSISQKNDAFRVERVPVPSPGSLILRVSLHRDVPPGDLRDTLELRLLNSEYVLHVPLCATCAEAISIVPRTVFLRKDGNTQTFRPVEFIVKVLPQNLWVVLAPAEGQRWIF